MTAAGAGDLPALDPELAPIVDAMPDFALEASGLPAVRELMGALRASLDPEQVQVREFTVDRDTGSSVRVLSPPADGAGRACVFAIHGGGYVLGDRAMDDERLAEWVAATGCTTVSVEYRLAPEHPYPAALDDCVGGLRWLHDHADDLGVDPARIGVAGVSAGGGLAAALALWARDHGGPPIAFQLLDSPMLDDRQCTPSSRADGLAVWSRDSNAFGWRSYLGELHGADEVPAYAAPARATDLGGLPPTLVLVGAVDGFRDEDVAYATRLCQAGVATELHVYPGAPHGFSRFPDVAVARQAADDVLRWLRRRFEA